MKKETETNKPTHECFNCRYYRPYYEKGYACFMRCDYGNCIKNLNPTFKHSCCDMWGSRLYISKKIKAINMLKELESGLTNISAIKTILSEEIEKEQ